MDKRSKDYPQTFFKLYTEVNPFLYVSSRFFECLNGLAILHASKQEPGRKSRKTFSALCGHVTCYPPIYGLPSHAWYTTEIQTGKEVTTAALWKIFES